MKIACLFALFIFCYPSYIQSQPLPAKDSVYIIGECMDGTDVHTRLEYEVKNNDTVYTLSMRNPQSSNKNFRGNDYTSIRFPGNTRIVNQLYTVLKSVFVPARRRQKKQNLIITLGDKMVVVNTERVLGVPAAAVYLPGGYCYLTEWQVDKVFGKI